MEKRILVLDIETTGFQRQGGSIIEIGIVELCLDTGDIKEVFSSLLRENILTAKHKEKPFGWIFENSDLTVEALREAPAAKEVFPKVQEILNNYPLGCTAFNKNFDFGFLRSRGIVINDLPCPMILSTNICELPGQYGNYKWPKVEEAFSHFFPEVEYTEKHRGADDAKHEAMIVYELYLRGTFKIPALQGKNI
jgi:DNA polymerase III alpha subunit (gram-positive type)